MAITVEVTCSRKDKSETGAQEVTHIGGLYPNGRHWTLTEKVAIAGIECKAISLSLRREGHIYGLFVVTSPKGHKRLCAGGGEGRMDRLFDLPDCPAPE